MSKVLRSTCLYVCLFVCLYLSASVGYVKKHMCKFHSMLPVAVARTVQYVMYMDDVVFSYNGANRPKSSKMLFAEFARWRHWGEVWCLRRLPCSCCETTAFIVMLIDMKFCEIWVYVIYVSGHLKEIGDASFLLRLRPRHVGKYLQ